MGDPFSLPSPHGSSRKGPCTRRLSGDAMEVQAQRVLNSARSTVQDTYSCDQEQGQLMLKQIRMTRWKLLLNVLILVQTGCDSPSNPSGIESDAADTRYFTALHERQFRSTRHEAIRLCGNCHAKGSSKRTRTLTKPIPQLCYDCHEDYRTVTKHLHGPVAAGACLPCHDPHVSIYIHLQTVAQPRLCTRCHEPGKTYRPETHPDTSDTLCTECHDPHVGAKEMLLKK